MNTKLTLLAAFALGATACQSTDYQAQNHNMGARQPTNFSQDTSASMAESSNAIAGVSMNSFQWSADGVRLASVSTTDLFKAGLNFSAAGVAVSKDSAAMILETSGNVIEGSKSASQKAFDFAVTSTGRVVDLGSAASKSAVNSSRTAFFVSVDFSKSAATTSSTVVVNVWDFSKNMMIGSLTVSGKAAEMASSAIKAGSKFMVDTSGTLLTSSGQVIGQVWESSGKALSFVVDNTGKFFKASAATSYVIVTSTSKHVSSFATGVWGSMQKSGTVAVNVAKASAQGSVMILQASGQSIMAVSDAVGIHQEKY